MENLPNLESFNVTELNDEYSDFLTYYNEAEFTNLILREKINKMSKNSRILEVGSGIGLFANHLYSMGYKNLKCIEPDAQGFEMMSKLSKIVSSHELYKNSKLDSINDKIEDFDSSERFDFIFSINVMEHVDDPNIVLKKIEDLLAPGGEYYFICPNYLFPYETHFNIPLLFTKNLTFRIFKLKISNFDFQDPIGLWDSLNWINPIKVRKYQSNFVELSFHNSVIKEYFKRLKYDSAFKKRKGTVFSLLAFLAKGFIRVLPTQLKPIIECTMRKKY